MFCPVCKAEYRDGYTHCADCDVDLVESLQPASDAGEHDPFVQVSSARWNSALARQTAALDAQKIPYRTLDRDEFAMGLLGGGVLHTIWVPPSQIEAARAALAPELEYEEAHPEGDADPELGDPGEALAPEDGADVGPSPVHPDRWNPGDATVPIWKGAESNIADMVVICLRENGIHWRVDDGSTPLSDEANATEDEAESVLAAGQPITVFVLPEDEQRAKEIVREISAEEPL